MHVEAKSRPSATGRRPEETFHAGPHVLRLCSEGASWRVEVDGVTSGNRYDTQAEAWEAGVREADRLDRAGAGRVVSLVT